MVEKDTQDEETQTTEHEASIHLNWMREAMLMVRTSFHKCCLILPHFKAEEALAHSEVPVGCVFVRKHRVIARARNRTNELRNVTIRSPARPLGLIPAYRPQGMPSSKPSTESWLIRS
jgi:hypothetical protein